MTELREVPLEDLGRLKMVALAELVLRGDLSGATLLHGCRGRITNDDADMMFDGRSGLVYIHPKRANARGARQSDLIIAADLCQCVVAPEQPTKTPPRPDKIRLERVSYSGTEVKLVNGPRSLRGNATDAEADLCLDTRSGLALIRPRHRGPNGESEGTKMFRSKTMVLIVKEAPETEHPSTNLEAS